MSNWTGAIGGGKRARLGGYVGRPLTHGPLASWMTTARSCAHGAVGKPQQQAVCLNYRDINMQTKAQQKTTPRHRPTHGTLTSSDKALRQERSAFLSFLAKRYMFIIRQEQRCLCRSLLVAFSRPGMPPANSIAPASA